MKKKLLGVLSVIALVAVAIVPVHAANAAPPQTDVTGVVTNNGNPVAGAVVTAVCQGNTEVDATTDAHGSYLVVFPIDKCPFGSTVKVMAKKGGHSGTNSGTAEGLTTKLNIAVVNVSIPEFGTIGAILAAGTGIGAFMYMRRRGGNVGGQMPMAA